MINTLRFISPSSSFFRNGKHLLQSVHFLFERNISTYSFSSAVVTINSRIVGAWDTDGSHALLAVFLTDLDVLCIPRHINLFTTVLLNILGPLDSNTVHVSPSIFSNLNGLLH